MLLMFAARKLSWWRRGLPDARGGRLGAVHRATCGGCTKRSQLQVAQLSDLSEDATRCAQGIASGLICTCVFPCSQIYLSLCCRCDSRRCCASRSLPIVWAMNIWPFSPTLCLSFPSWWRVSLAFLQLYITVKYLAFPVLTCKQVIVLSIFSDESEEVEGKCHEVVAVLEKILGEPLKSQFWKEIGHHDIIYLS